MSTMIRRALPCGYELPDNLDLATWEAKLRLACRDRSTAQWRIGDLLNYGEHRYGDAYQKARDATGLSYQTIANVKSVAKAFEISRRRENLSFGHHAEVASMPAEDQDRLLDAAVKESLTRSQLRESVSELTRRRASAAVKETKADPQPKVVRVEVTRTPIDLNVPVSDVTYTPIDMNVSVSDVTYTPIDMNPPQGHAPDAPSSLRRPQGHRRRYEDGAFERRAMQDLKSAAASPKVETTDRSGTDVTYTPIDPGPLPLTDVDRQVAELYLAWLRACPEARDRFLAKIGHAEPAEPASGKGNDALVH